MRNWIKLNRGLIEDDLFCDCETMRVFIYLLLYANHNNNYKINNIVLFPGQLITGRKKLSHILNLSEQSVRTALKKLVYTNKIQISDFHSYSLITILNFDNYCNDEINGWIKLTREILNHDIFFNIKATHLFLYFLLLAKDSNTKVQDTILFPGQLMTSQRLLIKSLNLTHKSIREALKKLEQSGTIKIETKKSGTLITINNWLKYQSISITCDNNNQNCDTAHQGHTKGTPRAHLE